MAGPTPILANGQVDFLYTFNGLTHRQQLRCQVASFSSTASRIELFSGGDDDADTLFQAYAAVLSGILKTTTNLDRWILQEYVDGAYIPRQENAIGNAGFSSLAQVTASQQTYVFRDDVYKLAKVITLEGIGTPPAHENYGDLATVEKALVDDLLNHTGTHSGNWVCSRAGHPFRSFSALTTSLNRTVRRKRGLV